MNTAGARKSRRASARPGPTGFGPGFRIGVMGVASIVGMLAPALDEGSATGVAGALLAYLLVEQVDGLLPISFALAAGAMLSLVLVELAPEAFGGRGRGGRWREPCWAVRS